MRIAAVKARLFNRILHETSRWNSTVVEIKPYCCWGVLFIDHFILKNQWLLGKRNRCFLLTVSLTKLGSLITLSRVKLDKMSHTWHHKWDRFLLIVFQDAIFWNIKLICIYNILYHYIEELDCLNIDSSSVAFFISVFSFATQYFSVGSLPLAVEE